MRLSVRTALDKVVTLAVTGRGWGLSPQCCSNFCSFSKYVI